MRLSLICAALFLSWVSVVADEMPAVDDAIPESIRALGEPDLFPFKSGVRILVMTKSQHAQDYVNQGLNHLHGGWETEAARHFAAAMTADPDCVLAHWGMVMSLLTPSPETGPARNAATDRLLSLIEQGKGSELERGYAYALLKYIEEGPLGAAAAFSRVARQFPNDMQSPVFEALFSRGGFDETGQPKPDQERSERMLTELIRKHPENSALLNALLTIRADGGDLSGHLDMARKLGAMQPDYAPYLHLLGHYEWRCGNHADAVRAFGKATELYEKWMTQNRAGVADCHDWVRSEAYRIVALSSRGDFDAAFTAARQLAGTQVPEARMQSPGGRALFWEGRTLPARLLLRRGYRGNAAEAQISLPSVEEMRAYRDLTLASWWIDGLRIALEARRVMDVGDFADARGVVAALTLHGERMAETQFAASSGGERSAWMRAFRGLEVIAAETRGLLALAGPEVTRGTAFNWFRGAVDRQHPATMMYPPAVLTPMAARLGDFHLSEGDAALAVAAFEEALAGFPNDMNAMIGLLDAAEAAGDQAKVDATGKAIEALRGE
jgi:tetratricopeptide (TPR) repeat protein